MDEIKNALLRMVTSAIATKKMADAYLTVGLDDNTLHKIYGDICDAIYYLIGERMEDFSKSVTCLAVTAPFLTDERRAELLWSEYVRNHPFVHVDQPKPLTITREQMRHMTELNGGYMTPEGDWQ